MLIYELIIRTIQKKRKVFYLTKVQMKKRVKFCNSILEKKLNGQQIMFTYETKGKL